MFISFYISLCCIIRAVRTCLDSCPDGFQCIGHLNDASGLFHCAPQWLLSNPYESCSEACGRVGMECNEPDTLFVDTMDKLSAIVGRVSVLPCIDNPSQLPIAGVQSINDDSVVGETGKSIHLRSTANQVCCCGANGCDFDCVVSEWSSWTECSVASCESDSIRTRTVITPPRNNGIPCTTDLTQSQPCPCSP
jgi:hypothetical protein